MTTHVRWYLYKIRFLQTFRLPNSIYD